MMEAVGGLALQSDEKYCGMVVLCMVFPVQKQRRMELRQKHFICYNATHNHYRWNLDAWLQTRI